MSIQDLDQRFPIINPDGTASDYFMRLLKDRGSSQAAVEGALEEAAAWEVQGGVGIEGGGPVSEGVVLDLADTAVTPGSYTLTNITVDAQGRITAAANGSSGAGYTRVRLLALSTAATFNVNSVTYVRQIPLSFGIDLAYFNFSAYRIHVSGASNAAAQTVTLELHSVGGGDPAASAGNDLVLNNAGALYSSAWVTRTDGFTTGLKEYTLFSKGSNATVDFTATFIDIELRI